MKSIFNKIILGALLLTSSLQPMHAGLSQIGKYLSSPVLEKIGNNPGWVAFALMVPCMYDHIVRNENIQAVEEKTEALWRSIKGCSIVLITAVTFCAVCKWWASKF